MNLSVLVNLSSPDVELAFEAHNSDGPDGCLPVVDLDYLGYIYKTLSHFARADACQQPPINGASRVSVANANRPLEGMTSSQEAEIAGL